MSDELRRVIIHHYGSVAKFCDRVGIHRSTLSRVLSKKYQGDSAGVEDTIRRQLAVDGIRIDWADLPALADRGFQALGERLAAVAGTLHLIERATTHPGTAEVLKLARSEIESIRGQINGR